MSKAKLIFKSKAKRPPQTRPEQDVQPQKQEQSRQKKEEQQPVKQPQQRKSIESHQQAKQQSKQTKSYASQDMSKLQARLQKSQSIFSQINIRDTPKTTEIQLSQEQRLRRNLAQMKKRKLLQIIQSKKKQETSESRAQKASNHNSNINTQKQKQQESKNQEQTDLNNSRVCKHKGKHFKIYNEEHFKDTEQIKTSTHRWEYGNGTTPDKILISSWNLNGIRARYNNNDIQPYVGKVRPDIFCVNQHKMDQKSYDELLIKFPGYFSYWNFSKISLAYSGVAIFSRYPAISMTQDMPQQKKQFCMQGRVITLQFQKFVIVNAYIPTSGKQLQRLAYRTKEWDPVFMRYVVGLKQKFKQKVVIVCGDLNVSHQQLDCHTGARMKQNREPSFTLAQRFNFSKLLQAGYIDTFRALHPNQRAYTWWNLRRGGRKRMGTLGIGIGKRLDYFLVNKQHFGKVTKSIIAKQWQGNDHCPIQLQIDFSIKQQNQKTKQKDQYQNTQKVGEIQELKMGLNQQKIQYDAIAYF